MLWYKLTNWTLLNVVLLAIVSKSAGDPYEVQNGAGTFVIKHSDSQTMSGDTIEVLVIPGHTDFDTPETSIINDRYLCDNYSMLLYIEEVNRPNKLYLNISLTGNTGETPECKVWWGDDKSDDNVEIEKGNSTVITHVYSNFGIYRVSMRCEVGGLNSVNCPLQQNNCFKDPNFFENSYTMFPMLYLSKDPFKVDSYIEISNVNCTSPIIKWRITKIDENGVDTFVSIINFIQPETSVLRLPSGTLENGLYVVTLEVMFSSISVNEWTDDSFLLKVVDPELVAYISGGDYLEFPYGDELLIYADESHDPLNESSVLQPLQAAWSFLVFSPAPELNATTLDTMLINFPTMTLPPKNQQPYNIYKIEDGSEYVLKVQTTLLATNSYCLAMFSLTRGNRMASALQVIKIVQNVLPFSIDCIYNCHIGRDRIFYYDRLELDLNFSTVTDTTGFSFYWSVLQWNGTMYTPPDTPISTETGYGTSSLGIQSGSLVQGNVYQIKVVVSSPGRSAATAQLVKTVNYVPTGGECLLDAGSTTVISAREWLTFECVSWIKQDPITKAINYQPILSFTVRQKTVGAKVKEEPILQTTSKKSFVILKVGDPSNSYLTDLHIRVTDIYNNYHEQLLQITSLPAFEVDDVNPNEAGSAIVRSYTETDYPFDEQQLRDMGKSDMMISLVSAVCSNIHLIDLGEWVPPVPRVLNSDGYVMDLHADGNKDVGRLDEVIANADNNTDDPATLAIQDVIESMVSFIRDIVEHDLNGPRSGDKLLASLVTNAFTNLVAEPRYLNYESMSDIIYLAKIVGFDALLPQNSSSDNAAQTETSSGEVYFMFQEIVRASVPNDVVEMRPVGSLVSGRNNIDEMLLAMSENISLYDSQLSPLERAYLYVRMQKHLKYNTEEKKKTAKEAADMSIKLAQEVQNQWKLCRKCSNDGNQKTKQLLQNAESEHFITQMTNTTTSKFRIDGLNNTLENISIDLHNTVSVSTFEFQENVFMYDSDDTSSFVTSKVLRIDIKAAEQRVTPGFMTFKQEVLTPSPEHVVPEVHEEDVSEFMYHRFIYQKATDEVCMIIRPMGLYNFTEYLVYIKFTSSPSIIDYDFRIYVKEEHDWQHCVQPEKMRNHTGLTYMALSLPGSMKTVEYNLTIVTAGCLTWEERLEKWRTDKCELEWNPEEEFITCFCREITDLVFSNSFFVAPNSIDFSSIFLRFSPLNQAAVIGTLSGIFVCYIIAVFYLSGLDRQDSLKWGVTPLRDNMINDDNYYIVKVFTGMRRGAGTKSRVAFVLTGSNGSTRPRELYDGVREDFSTGSVMSFFLATTIRLGDLLHLYIWHDNSGGSHAAWYLNQVIIYDIETLTAYTFIAERWLSIDTTLDACLTCNPSNHPIKFESRFFFQLRDRFSENHTWISILYRPQTSTFTRVQRVSCALAYIFLTMLANAMYFNPEPNYVSPAILEVGPFRFTKQQIFISIVCAAITTPPIMFLVYIFQHTKRRKHNDDNNRKSSRCCRKQRYSPDRDKFREIMLSSEVPQLKGGIRLPFWFVYIGWLLLLGAIFAPAFFIVLYSIEWGKQKSEEWLTTFFMSIFESILFVDPILVVCIVLVLSILVRTNTVDTSIDIQRIVERYKKKIGHVDGIDGLSTAIRVLKTIKPDFDSLEENPRRVTPPIQGSDLTMAAEKHRYTSQISTFLKDILLNMFLIIILSSIAYANRDPRSYRYHEEIVNTIVNPRKLPQFNAIKTPGDVYNWLNVSVIPSLFPEFDINGAPLHWTVRQFTNEYHNLRLGPPRLRQLRVKHTSCKIPYIGTENCYGKYEILDDEESNFCLGWTQQPCPASEAVFNVSVDAWKYTSAIDIWGLPTPGVYTTYGGGGYLATFDIGRNISNDILNELYKNLWIDRQTRAVLFEFTIYNAVINMFVYNIFLIEFLQSGGVVTSYSIYPIRVYTHHGAIGTYTLVCDIIFVLYISFVFVKTCVRIYKKRCGFFKEFWYVYELVMLLTGIVVAVFYALRLSFAHTTINKFNRDKKVFVNFAHIILWDQILVSALAILVFMATLRLLEVFASSKKVNAVIRVFKDCGKDLLWYSVTFLHVFFAFCILGVLMFGSKLTSYKDINSTMGTLFITLVGKSKFTELDDKEPVFAKLFFSLYIIVVVFFVLTIFLSILGVSIDNAVHDSRKDPREDWIEYVMKTVQSLISRPAKKRSDVKKYSPIHESPVIGYNVGKTSPPIAEELCNASVVLSRDTSPDLTTDDETESDESEEIESVISEMSEMELVLPTVEEPRVSKVRSITMNSKRPPKPTEKPPWRL